MLHFIIIPDFVAAAASIMTGGGASAAAAAASVNTTQSSPDIKGHCAAGDKNCKEDPTVSKILEGINDNGRSG